MQRLSRDRVLITFGILIICIVSGCTPVDNYEDDEYEAVTCPLYPEEEYDGPLPATAVEVSPRPRATIPSDTHFALTFDGSVLGATANGFPAIGAGPHWTVSPILSEGEVTLHVTWINYDDTIGYRAIGPYFIKNLDITTPLIVGGIVRDRDRNVDPAPINMHGFRYNFDEPVTGTIQLTDEAGVDLNWVGIVAEQTATLTTVAGQELVNETTYKIEIDVQDGAGNSLETTITFVTKPK